MRRCADLREDGSSYVEKVWKSHQDKAQHRNPSPSEQDRGERMRRASPAARVPTGTVMLCFYTLGGQGSSPSSALVSFCEQICFPVVWAGATALLPWQSAAASGSRERPARWVCRVLTLPYLTATINTLGP